MTRPPLLLFAVLATSCVHADRERTRVHDELIRSDVATAQVRDGAGGEEPAPAPSSGEGLDRRAMIAAYLAASPELGAFDADVSAQLAAIEVAGSVEAPELMVQVWNVPFRRPYALDDASMWMAIVSQRFEPRGVRRERVREESAEARALIADRAAVALEVARRATADHATIAQLDATLEARLLALTTYEHLVRASESLIASGRVDARMLAEVRAGEARAHGSIASVRARRDALVRVANVRMGRDPAEPLVVAVDSTPVDLDALRRRVDAHPALAATDARTEAAEARVLAASHASRRPSLSVGVGVFEEPHAGVGYGLQVGLSLPWIGGRARAERRLAEAAAARVDSERDVARRTIVVELESAFAELAAADSAIRAIDESSLPALEDAARATASGLASGATTIRDVLQVNASLAELRIERAEWLGARLSAESALFAWFAILDVGTESP